MENPYFAYRDFVKRINLAILADRVSDGTVQPLSCVKISCESMVKVAESCRHLKRLKLNECEQLDDVVVMAFALNCLNILEIDLQQCRSIGNDPITALIRNGNALRELRLANCEILTDNAFLNLPHQVAYDHLRILDLTSCSRLTDAAVEKIISVAPRLRNLVFAKCRLIDDSAVNSHQQAGEKPSLPSPWTLWTDYRCRPLAEAQRQRQLGHRGHHIDDPAYTGSCLERVHLSYCTNLTLESIIRLLKSCPKLTHLSLTGVQAFLRSEFEQFCREAPREFTEHQRNVFCVFSGPGVNGLRNYLTRDEIEIVNEDNGRRVGDENIEDVIGPMIQGLIGPVLMLTKQ
ncbi:hypothetical protein DID88_009831 [Monilinia fructigena]|uniref:F-box/LRR-repeat protein 15-like leucin rich repeat domain-containing protein n=1 Tax=Monilinia fructigena TaxID=38457 RepID=A0A395IKE6_9HELO|nr:hypothetical protein DID88_009831 [Monilinia fructigena]